MDRQPSPPFRKDYAPARGQRRGEGSGPSPSHTNEREMNEQEQSELLHKPVGSFAEDEYSPSRTIWPVYVPANYQPPPNRSRNMDASSSMPFTLTIPELPPSFHEQSDDDDKKWSEGILDNDASSGEHMPTLPPSLSFQESVFEEDDDEPVNFRQITMGNLPINFGGINEMIGSPKLSPLEEPSPTLPIPRHLELNDLDDPAPMVPSPDSRRLRASSNRSSILRRPNRSSPAESVLPRRRESPTNHHHPYQLPPSHPSGFQELIPPPPTAVLPRSSPEHHARPSRSSPDGPRQARSSRSSPKEPAHRIPPRSSPKNPPGTAAPTRPPRSSPDHVVRTTVNHHMTLLNPGYYHAPPATPTHPHMLHPGMQPMSAGYRTSLPFPPYPSSALLQHRYYNHHSPAMTPHPSKSPATTAALPSPRHLLPSSSTPTEHKGQSTTKHAPDTINKRNKENQRKQQGRVPCNCKKSKCLKLYCDCFAQQLACAPSCKCLDCHNILGSAERERAIAEHERRSTKKKEEVSKVGCKCKKSKCLKKYCECFNAGVVCRPQCKCVDCQNQAGSQKLIDKRRKMKDEKGTQYAVQMAAKVWSSRSAKNPSPVAMGPPQTYASTHGRAPYLSNMGRPGDPYVPTMGYNAPTMAPGSMYHPLVYARHPPPPHSDPSRKRPRNQLPTQDSRRSTSELTPHHSTISRVPSVTASPKKKRKNPDKPVKYFGNDLPQQNATIMGAILEHLPASDRRCFRLINKDWNKIAETQATRRQV